jgi:rhodanese-related sulfurtransferase
MPYLALALSLRALVLALAARKRAESFSKRIEDADRDARRRSENAAEELSAELSVLRRSVAEIAAGRPPTPDMVLEGRLWRDASPAEGRRMVEEAGVRLLDVRTATEVSQGKLSGALHIPIDELEQRQAEIPRDGEATLIYCAGGGRSAAACEYLSNQGWSNLFNLEGGIQAWPGSIERPS